MIDRIGGVICVRVRAANFGRSSTRVLNPRRRRRSCSLSIGNGDTELRLDSFENIDDDREGEEREEMVVSFRGKEDVRPEKGLQTWVGGISDSFDAGDEGSDEAGGSAVWDCIACAAGAMVATPPPGAVTGYLVDVDGRPRYFEDVAETGDTGLDPGPPDVCIWAECIFSTAARC